MYIPKNQKEHSIQCAVPTAVERDLMMSILGQAKITLRELETMISFHEAVNYSTFNHALLDLMSIGVGDDGEAVHPRVSHCFDKNHATNIGIALSFSQEMALERGDQV